jgi:hypothetical protein
MVPNITHTLQFTLPELWSLTFTMYIQFRIFRLQYSTQRISAAIGDILSIQWALYCKLSAKYSGQPQFRLSELWSRPYTVQLQLLIFRLQYSTESICAAIVDISTIQCALYCKHGTKYSAHPPVDAIWPVFPDIYNENTVPHILASIFKWTYLRRYSRYVENSMRLILQTLWQILRTSSRLRHLYCVPGHIQYNYSSTYSGFNIQMNVSELLLEICRLFNAPCSAIFVSNTSLRYLNCGP